MAGFPAFGHYTTLRPLGTGGYGEVFLAVSPGRRLVAIKALHSELADEARDRLAREVEAAKRVRGPYIAQVIESDLACPRPWIAAEYVESLTLREYVRRGQPLDIDRLADLAAGLAEGLNAIHAEGIVHRDLSTGNVLIADNGPRIIDFGLASAAEWDRITGSGDALGTPGYMSPEQASGSKTITSKSDIFSLGAVLTFAATGASPFGAGPGRRQRNARDRPDVSSVPEEFRALLLRCMDQDPQARPTASEFLAEVNSLHPPSGKPRKWLPIEPDEQTITAPPASLRGGRYRTKADKRQVRGGAIAAATVLAGLAIGVIVAFQVNGPAAPRYLSFRAGQCLAGTGLASALQLTGFPEAWPDAAEQVSCRGSHLAEVYYASENFWPRAAGFPGQAVVTGAARTECDTAFGQYDGIPFAQTEYSLDILYPTASSWATGDRSLQCVAFLAAQTEARSLTGSIKGTRR